jgi:hypothetical protein
MRILLLLPIIFLTGCAPLVSLEAAEDANNPACAEVSVRVPDEIPPHERRYTNAQATAAWGEPTAIIYRCGLPPVEVSTLPCVTAGGVDWLVDESQAPSFRFISYGRSPATEVIVDSEQASGITALEELAPAVSTIPATKFCSAIG